MTTEQKQQLFIGTLTLEVILILAIGWALFAPVGHPPEAPPVVEQTPDEPPPALTLPEVASGTNTNLPPGPILTAAAVKATIARSWIGICRNGAGAPPCCGSGSTPGTNDPGIQPHCALGLDTAQGSTLFDNVTFNAIYSVSDVSFADGKASGCSACGGSAAADTDSPALEFRRYHRYRDVTEGSSFGPGVFSNYDVRLHMYSEGWGANIVVFDPQDHYPRNSGFQIQLFDASGNPTSNGLQAATATLVTHQGITFHFEFFASAGEALPSGFNLPTDAEPPPALPAIEGRLTAVRDRNGRGVAITYRTWTPEQVEESPERQWQIASVSDAQGRTATFRHAAEQVSGRWAVSQIALPENQVIGYEYAAGKLSRIAHPDGSESLFQYGFDEESQTTRVDIVDPGVAGGTAGQHLYLTNNFAGRPGSEEPRWPGNVYSQASLLTRLATNSLGEVQYFSLPRNSSESWIYEGGGKVGLNGYADPRYFGDWEFTPLSQEEVLLGALDPYDHGFGDNGPVVFSGQGEPSYNAVGYPHYQPDFIRDEAGRIRTFSYGPDLALTTVGYSDGTWEHYSYNEFRQPTRQRDREGSVVRMTYDARGNLLQREVGLVEASPGGNYEGYGEGGGEPVDVATAEYAVYQYEYYPESHANEFLLAAEIDPNGNRTDYQYDANQRLVKVLQPPDETSGPRAETTYTYDDAGRLKITTDPVGRTTERFYDPRGRLVKILYGDDSTERFFFGTGAQAGLLVKQKDRGGVVTDYEYDDAGRRIRTVHAAALMDTGDVETPISDPSLTIEETLTYLPGTDRVATRTRAGETTSYEYDYRHRVVGTTVQPRSGVELTSRTQYLNNQVLCREDPYGRKTYYAYRVSDGALIREIQGTVPSFELADFSAVLNQVRVADPHANGTSIITDYLLDDEGHEIERIDGRAVHHTTAYDSRGRVVATVAASGTAVAATTETLYDAAGNVLEVQHPRYFDGNDPAAAGCRTVMTYTGRNLLKTRTEAPGAAEQAVEQFTYTLDGRQDTRTDARENDWRTLWASCCARQQATIDPLGHGTISSTDYAGRVTHSAVVEDVASHTNLNDPLDAKTLQEVTTRYDARGRVIARTVWLVPRGAVDPENVPIAGLDSVSAEAGLTTQMVYDEDLTDGVGLDSSTGGSVAQLGGGTYNVSIAAVLAKLADPPASGGAGITFGTGSNGSAAVSINPEEELHVTIQDGAGRTVCTAVIQPHDGQSLNALVTWSSVLHDTVANIANFGDVLETAAISALGAVTRSRTDGAGRTIQTVDAQNYAANYMYDAAGNPVTVRDPNNVGQNCTFDALGRRIQCSDTQELLESTNRRWEFDLAGNVVKEWDAKNHATTHVYDARNRKTGTTDRLDGTTQWAFDPAGNLLSLTDAEDQTTSYEYDDAGRKVKETYPDHVPSAQVGSLDYGIVEFAYDPAGRGAVRTDQQGDTCTYGYDLAGRLASRAYVGHASGPLSGQSDTDSFTYDAAGRMLTAVSERYDNPVTFTYDHAGRRATESLTIYSQTYTVGTEYDAEGNVSRLVYPDGSLVDRAYTPRGQLQQITYAGQVIDTRNYDAGTRLTTTTYGNGITTTRSYRSDNLTATIDIPGVDSFAYSYDANKNKTAETRGGVMQPYGYTATYDDKDRLTGWQRHDGELSQNWDLSALGDWNTTIKNMIAENRSHGPAHELTAVDAVSVASDAKGSITQDHNLRLFDWDFKNLLHGTTVPAGAPGVAGVHAYGYDALGRRVAKIVAGTTTVFVNAWHRLFGTVQVGQVAAKYCLGSSPDQPQDCYVYGSYVDEPVAKNGAGGLICYHANDLFSVAALTDGAGAVMERYAYDAYGEALYLDANAAEKSEQQPGFGNTYNYAGREIDPESGLTYYRSRMLNSGLGRFLRRDGLGYIDGLSLYEYAKGRPTVLTDPTGGCGGSAGYGWAPVPSCFCCCAVSITWAHLGDAFHTTSTQYWANSHINVTFNVNYIKVPAGHPASGSDCDFEWQEWADTNSAYGPGTEGVWNDAIAATFEQGGGTNADAVIIASRPPTGGPQSYTIDDNLQLAGVPGQTVRNGYLGYRLRDGQHCPCRGSSGNRNEKILRLHQRVDPSRTPEVYMHEITGFPSEAGEPTWNP